jgi:Ca2+-binding EF-hand superfamily protein
MRSRSPSSPSLPQPSLSPSLSSSLSPPQVMAKKLPQEEVHILKAIFNELDRDGSGAITPEEFQEALRIRRSTSGAGFRKPSKKLDELERVVSKR